MPNYQVSFFIEGVQQAEYGASAVLGWSETWYGTNAGSVDAILTDRDVTTYIAKRREALAQEYRMSFVRVNDVDNPRLFKILTLQNALGNAKGTGTQYTPAQAALLVDLARLARDFVHNEPTHHRRFLLRGLPDGIISGNVVKTAASGWAAIKAFLQFIGNHETGTPARGAGPNVASWLGARFHDPTFSRAVITSLSVDPNNPRNIRMQPVPIAPDGTRFAIANSPYREFNRTWTQIGTVGTAPTNSVVLGQSRVPLFPTLAYTGPGKATFQRVAYQYGTFDQFTVIGARIKKTGSVFRHTRGRSSRKSV